MTKAEIRQLQTILQKINALQDRTKDEDARDYLDAAKRPIMCIFRDTPDSRKFDARRRAVEEGLD